MALSQPRRQLTESRHHAALVTGGAIRLGRAFALHLASKGYDIALLYNRSSEAAETTAAEIRQLGVRCHLYRFDLGQTEEIPNLMKAVCADLSRLDLLVNSASVYGQATLLETTPELFDQQFQVNLKAPFFLTQAFAKRVSAGNVINILDNKIGFNQPQYAAYLLAKKALAEFTTMAALELAPRIRVNGVAPGVVLPASTRSEEYMKWRISGIPLKKQGLPVHLTRAVDYILDNDFVSGQVLVVDGAESVAHIGLNAGLFDQTKI